MPGRSPPPSRFPAPRLAGWLALLSPLLALVGSARADEPLPAEVAAVRRLLRDPAPSARAAAVRRLAGASTGPALAPVLEALADPHPYVRRAAAGVLGLVPEPAARARLASEAPRWRSEPARAAFCHAAALWLDETGRAALRALLRDPAPGVRREALRWLAEERDEASAEALRGAVADPDAAVRAEALALLSASPEAAAGLGGLPLERLLGDADPGVRQAALEGLVLRGGDAAAVGVLRLLDDPSWSVRLLAATLAGGVRDRRMLRALVTRLGDGRLRVREAASRSLVRLTGLPFEDDAAAWDAWLAAEGAAFDPAQAEPAARPAEPPRPGSRTVATARFLDLPIRSRHVAFVLDGSGSMDEPLPAGGTRWTAVLADLERALTALAGAHGNVAVFADRVEAALPRALPLDAGRRETVLRFVRARRPAGRTALYDGIAWGLSDPEVDTVVVLSDGAPSAGAWFTKTDLLAEVRRANRWRRARIDVIAVGADGVARRWRDVLVTLAEESGGTCLLR